MGEAVSIPNLIITVLITAAVILIRILFRRRRGPGKADM